MKLILSSMFLFAFLFSIQAQDKVVYKEKMNGFYQDTILPSIKNFDSSKKDQQKGKFLSLDLSSQNFPTDVNEYNAVWHNKPLSQGATGTCWCFATISFLESEVYRITGEQIKLSEIYVVYWEYVARAKYFVQHRGDMYFGQGSESNAVIRIIKEHGLIPASEYSGLLKGQRFHNHGPLAKEIKEYLYFIKKNNIWDEEAVVGNVRSILDYYLGVPPSTVSHKSQSLTPQKYMEEILQLVPGDYFSFMSTLSLNYNEKGELKEPDNWWHNDDYYNLPLEDFHGLLTQALDAGYSLSLCGDVSEPGYDRYEEIGIIPSFDIPEENIDEHAREFRVSNKSTTDDHCMHIVGYHKEKGKLWYLLKDSSSSGFDGPNKGYRFIREDYVRLKVLALLTHKYAAKEILDKIIK